MSTPGPFDQVSVAQHVHGPDGQSPNDDFTAAHDHTAPERDAPVMQDTQAGDQDLAPEPPHPERFADIQAQIGRKGPEQLYEFTL